MTNLKLIKVQTNLSEIYGCLIALRCPSIVFIYLMDWSYLDLDDLPVVQYRN